MPFSKIDQLVEMQAESLIYRNRLSDAVGRSKEVAKRAAEDPQAVAAAWEEIVVRLSDFGAEPDPAATPTEVAESVDHVMKPLASVYSRSIYGGAGRLSSEHTDTARQSMQLTSDRLVMSHSTIERFLSYYRLASLRRRFR